MPPKRALGNSSQPPAETRRRSARIQSLAHEDDQQNVQLDDITTSTSTTTSTRASTKPTTARPKSRPPATTTTTHAKPAAQLVTLEKNQPATTPQSPSNAPVSTHPAQQHRPTPPNQPIPQPLQTTPQPSQVPPTASTTPQQPQTGAISSPTSLSHRPQPQLQQPQLQQPQQSQLHQPQSQPPPLPPHQQQLPTPSNHSQTQQLAPPQPPPLPPRPKFTPIHYVPLTYTLTPPALPTPQPQAAPSKGKRGKKGSVAAPPPPPPLPPPVSTFPTSVTELLDIFGPITITQANIDKFEPCTLCLQPPELDEKYIISPCFHTAHYDCIFNWLEHLNDKQITKLSERFAPQIDHYRQQIERYNDQFNPREHHYFDPQTQRFIVYRLAPSIQEIEHFTPPPPRPLLAIEQKLYLDLECPVCHCDWRKAVLDQRDDDAFG